MCSTFVALLAAAAPAAADVVTLRFDLPEAPLAFFGVEFSADYAVSTNDVPGGFILDSRMHLEFNTEHQDGSFHDAADLLVQFQPPVEGLPFWNVSGADLGWSGTGSFVGDISTSELNLPLLDFPPDSFSLWFVRIVSADENNPLLGGQLLNSYIEVDVDVVPCSPGIALLALGLARQRRSRERPRAFTQRASVAFTPERN
jgi:hypothetical protein